MEPSRSPRSSPNRIRTPPGTCCGRVRAALLDGAGPVVLVDDELSTGRTALNVIEALHAIAPRSAVCAGRVGGRAVCRQDDRSAGRGSPSGWVAGSTSSPWSAGRSPCRRRRWSGSRAELGSDAPVPTAAAGSERRRRWSRVEPGRPRCPDRRAARLPDPATAPRSTPRWRRRRDAVRGAAAPRSTGSWCWAPRN